MADTVAYLLLDINDVPVKLLWSMLEVETFIEKNYENVYYVVRIKVEKDE